MNIKNLFIVVIILTSSVSIAQQSVLASGKNIQSTTGTVTYSVGLTHFKDATSNAGSSSSGMQIPYEVIEQLSIDETSSIALKIYPNPTRDKIYITSKQLENLEYRLLDNTGRLIIKGKIDALNVGVNLDKLSAAFYILNITKDNSIYKSYKIIKK
ncbi:MAG: T9SS type A sorting domain-containing protein [Oceanihabitans sp.]